jgi:hypothetical protein
MDKYACRTKYINLLSHGTCGRYFSLTSMDAVVLRKKVLNGSGRASASMFRVEDGKIGHHMLSNQRKISDDFFP